MFLLCVHRRCPCSVTFVLLLIKYYGATNTEIVKSLRKVLSIALSFAIYPKPVNSRYLGGMAATCASLVISYRLKRHKVRSRYHARTMRRADRPALPGGVTASGAGAGNARAVLSGRLRVVRAPTLNHTHTPAQREADETAIVQRRRSGHARRRGRETRFKISFIRARSPRRGPF